jgi:beta-glucosidase
VPEINDPRIDALIARLTLEEKVALLSGKDSWSLPPMPSIGLQSIVMSDGPAGVRGRAWDEREPSCNFPSPTAASASWDLAVVRRLGEALGAEARRKNVHVLLAPTINLHRAPYGGRHFEAFSEDPVLTAAVATAYVQGVQSQGVAATLKHYVANDFETERFTVDVRVDERSLRELYLAAFEQPVVEGGAWLVMSAYNAINGVTASENDLLESPLNDEWGFDGAVVSDWTAIRSLESARASQDIEMPGPSQGWGQALVDAVRGGAIAESVIDRKVRRILRLAERVGALESAEHASPMADARTDVVAVSRDTAVAGSVLLKNDGLLPLADPRRIALIGEGARIARTQGGGSATVIPSATVSPLEGIVARWPGADVTWNRGTVVQQGLAALDMRRVSTTDGEQGALVARFLDESGAELGREVRHSSFLVWFDGECDATRAHTVELDLVYRPDPDETGALLGVGGLADVELLVDGSPATRLELRTRPEDDPATAVLNPPWAPVDLTPSKGATPETMRITVRYRAVPGGIPDALALRIGTPPLRADEDALIAEAAAQAARADVAVVVVGTTSEVESEGFDRTTLALPGRQDDLVRAVAAANPRTIVVVNAGAPVLLPWRDEVAGVLVVWFPGQEFGHALADLLSGDREPGGRLPVTWPAREEDLPVSDVTPVGGVMEYQEGLHIGYRAWRRTSAHPAYPFGFGLGYTTMTVEGLEVTAVGDTVLARATVRNTGERRGKAVVQVYAARPDSAIERPATWLVGFAAVDLDAGATSTVDIRLPRRRFAHWNAGWQLEPGVFVLAAGLHVDDAGPSARVELR